LFILPALGFPLEFLGYWDPEAATMLIVAGIIAGLLVYAAAGSVRSRVSEPFAGGEPVSALERVTGTEFYDTMKDLKGLGYLYKNEETKKFDLYSAGASAVLKCTRFMQFLHNGILPTYIVWCLLGMVGLFIMFFFR
jgi:hypothetical protein